MSCPPESDFRGFGCIGGGGRPISTSSPGGGLHRTCRPLVTCKGERNGVGLEALLVLPQSRASDDSAIFIDVMTDELRGFRKLRDYFYCSNTHRRLPQLLLVLSSDARSPLFKCGCNGFRNSFANGRIYGRLKCDSGLSSASHSSHSASVSSS